MNDIKLTPEKYKKKSDNSGMGISMDDVSELSDRLSSKGGLWFSLTLVFLILTILISFGLWGYKLTLGQQEENLVVRIGELNEERDLEFERSLMELKVRIERMKDILESRSYPSSVFTVLEELVIPGVRFGEFESNLSEEEISIGILASTLNNLNKQVILFESDDRVKKVNLSSVSLDETGNVVSNILIKLKSSLFYSK